MNWLFHYVSVVDSEDKHNDFACIKGDSYSFSYV